MASGERGLCLVTGATGYVGGRLVPALLERGYRVRCLARNPDKLRGVPWADAVEVAQGDVSSSEDMAEACRDVDVVYYLVHSMTDSDGFASRDRRAALVTAQAARTARVRRIIYLSGLHPDGDPARLSRHLASRAEVGEIFLHSGVPTVVLQAAVIIGSGSASFEMLRHLTERLPVMVTPKWVRNRVQPIAVQDVLHYLVEAAALDGRLNRAFDIGGPDVLTYQEMIQRYAASTGLAARRMIPVAVLTPRLSSYWVGLITPVPNAIAIPLVESLAHEAICSEHDIDQLIAPPTAGLTGYERAVELALDRPAHGEVTTHWSQAYPGRRRRARRKWRPADPLPSDPDWAGGSAYVDSREQPTTVTAEQLWRVIDQLAQPTRNGQAHSHNVRLGDRWAVQAREPGRMLRLRSSHRLPGQAWLEFEARPRPPRTADYHQRVVFIPHGLTGHVFWKATAPIRPSLLAHLSRRITRSADERVG